MKRTVCTIGMLLLFVSAGAQRLKLQSALAADTIQLLLLFDGQADTALQLPFAAAFSNALVRFRQRTPHLHTVSDSMSGVPQLRFIIGTTMYVKRSESFWAAVGNSALAGAHVFMITRYGWTVPLLFYWWPTTATQVQVQFPPELVHPKNRKTDFTFHSDAWFASVQRQQKRNAASLKRTTYRLLKKLNRKVKIR
ncbi:MAG TPA: hypothetical protein PKE07_14955 [Lacibacter sp.]|nr:hypothetical protein [Lacibacter sp.]HMO90443.1 hypothetical protein [Lacibacter sp.]